MESVWGESVSRSRHTAGFYPKWNTLGLVWPIRADDPPYSARQPPETERANRAPTDVVIPPPQIHPMKTGSQRVSQNSRVQLLG